MKNLCCSLFLIKLQTWRPSVLLKRVSNTGAFLWILRKLSDNFFHRTHLNNWLWLFPKQKLVMIKLNKLKAYNKFGDHDQFFQKEYYISGLKQRKKSTSLSNSSFSNYSMYLANFNFNPKIWKYALNLSLEGYSVAKQKKLTS